MHIFTLQNDVRVRRGESELLLLLPRKRRGGKRKSKAKKEAELRGGSRSGGRADGRREAGANERE